MMADFDTWKFSSLVQFAREAQTKITELEAEVKQLAQDRKDLITEVRRLITQEQRDGNTNNDKPTQDVVE